MDRIVSIWHYDQLTKFIRAICNSNGFTISINHFSAEKPENSEAQKPKTLFETLRKMEIYNPEVFACFKSDTWVSYRLPAGWVLCIYPHPLDPAIERSHWSVSESASPIGRHNFVRRPIEGCDWWTQSWNAAALLTTVDDAVGWQGRASDCWRSDSCKRTQVRGWSSRVFERCWLSSEWKKHKYRRWKVWENRKDVTGGIGTCVCLKVLHQKAPHFTTQYSAWSVPSLAITCNISHHTLLPLSI